MATQEISAASFCLEIVVPELGAFIAYRPDRAEVEKTAHLAREIFTEAFATTYTEYHRRSGSLEPITTWLRLKEGLTLQTWLEATFDDEYQDYLEGKKQFAYLRAPDNRLIGWLSHGLVDEHGDIYFSQCSLEGSMRNQKIAKTVFSRVFHDYDIQEIFPGVKQVKLIARRINEIADKLYTGVGFTKDETIDPSVYGESYDSRYVGYRMVVAH